MNKPRASAGRQPSPTRQSHKRGGGLVGFHSRNRAAVTRLRGVDDEVDCRETPHDLFRELHAEYAFTVDVAANARNAKLPRYFDRRRDGLRQSWAGEMVWCNPPFSALGAWVSKAAHEVRVGCRGVVLLLPANRTEQGWWQDMVEPVRDRGLGVRTRFLRGRVKFRGAVTGAGWNQPPFGVVLVVMEPPR